ncbi:MAG: NAD(P)H-hydrate dehydratase [Rhodospirillales bacterium]|nr:NAD(P)H-hydrate dehydratase [Rhodospirillales bacterium]
MLANNQALLAIAEMTRADALAVKAGVPSDRLMEAAGWAVAMQLRKHFRPCRVLVLAGPGNNGGDGFVAARYLKRWGWPVRVALLGKQESLKGDAALNAARWEGEVEPLGVASLQGADLVVDALFGAGLARPLEGVARAVVTAISAPVVAIDIPSGVSGDTGQVLGAAPLADLTVTFFRKKPGHCLMPGRVLCGQVVVADIGIPAEVLNDIRPTAFENGPELWQLPELSPSAHKYSRGHVLILGGEMTGAARLAAGAAAKSGAGMVTLAVPKRLLPLYVKARPSLVLKVCDGPEDLQKLLAAKRYSAALAGPGLGVGETTRALVGALLKAGLPLVLDADALTSFEGKADDLFSHLHHPALLTPHEGEFKRLFERGPDKLSSVRLAARYAGASVLLKGPDTVVASPDGRAVIETQAPPWLATAGSGDVLAGIAVALIARGMTPFLAGAAADWLHGQAGLRAGEGLAAEDLIGQLIP